MRRFSTNLLILSVAIFFSGTAAAQENKETQAPAFPQAGSDLPGPFHLYNATGKNKGRFHCLVSEFGLNPVVMVIARDADLTNAPQIEPLRGFFETLDGYIDRNPKSRLAGFGAFLNSKLKDLAREDDTREQIEAQLEKLSEDAKLKHVILGISAPGQLTKYKLDEKAEVVVLVYDKYRTVAYHGMTWGEFTKEKAQAILDDLVKRFKLRKPLPPPAEKKKVEEKKEG